LLTFFFKNNYLFLTYIDLKIPSFYMISIPVGQSYNLKLTNQITREILLINKTNINRCSGWKIIYLLLKMLWRKKNFAWLQEYNKRRRYSLIEKEETEISRKYIESIKRKDKEIKKEEELQTCPPAVGLI